MAECSGNLFRALGDEKCSSTFAFVCTSCNRVGGHHISVSHIRDTRGVFFRQLLKLVVAFTVWEAFFFFQLFVYYDLSIRTRQDGDLFSAELFQRSDPHF